MKTPLQNFSIRAFWLPVVLVFGGLLLSGCGATAPVVNDISGPDTLETGENGSFNATIGNEQEVDDPVTYEWMFGDGATATGLSVTHTYNSTGEYTVNFRASNEGGADSSRTSVVVVRPPQPASITSINANPNPVDAGNQVRFSSNVTGDSPLSYDWSFGDGNSGSGEAPTHTYEEAGQYTVRLEASNDVGQDSRTLRIRVNPDIPSMCMNVSEFNSAYFGSNSSTLTSEAESSLQENADILSQCANLSVQVEGYAAPGERNAQSLSEDRAQAVANFYRENGVPSNRIMTSGEGEVEGVTTKKGGTREYRRADSLPQERDMGNM